TGFAWPIESLNPNDAPWANARKRQEGGSVGGTPGSPRNRRFRGVGWVPPTLFLASAAEDGGAAGQADQGERAAAAEAGLSGAPVDLEAFLLSADSPPGVAVRSDRAAAVGD